MVSSRSWFYRLKLKLVPRKQDNFDSVEDINLTCFQISYHGGGEGGESDDSEGENQELAQIDRGEFTFHMVKRMSPTCPTQIAVCLL